MKRILPLLLALSMCFVLVCPDTEVLEGLEIRGSIEQNSQDEAKETVDGWLEEIGTFGQE